VANTPSGGSLHARDGRVTSYICAGYSCQNPRPDPEKLARQLGIS
jgi:uncharacterized protein YyaL (SSP411 family)